MIDIDTEQTPSVPESPEGSTETVEQPVAEQPQPETQQPEQTQGGEEAFFDPNAIPEELKPAYKQMQAAFTKKTQEIAEQRKQAEALRQKAEAYDKYQQHIPIIEEMLTSRQQSQTNPAMLALREQYKKAGWNDEAIDFMEQGLTYALNHMNQTQAAEKQQQWVETQIAEATKLDPRLTDPTLVYQTDDGESITFSQMVESIASSDPNLKKDIVGATRRAIKRVDALIGKAKTEGKEELSQAAKAKASKFPSTQTSPQATSNAGGALSFREAARRAQEETGVRLK